MNDDLNQNLLVEYAIYNDATIRIGNLILQSKNIKLLGIFAQINLLLMNFCTEMAIMSQTEIKH